VPVRAFGRQWSRHPWDRVRTWDLRRPDLPAGRDLDRASAYAVMADAVATLNIHGDQDGFTMRTFEACGVGGVQLIDRADVTHLYEPGVELATYGCDDELLDLCRRAQRDRAWTESLRVAGRRRTLADHTFATRVAVLEELL
jgi:spore maturation protein CgeB